MIFVVTFIAMLAGSMAQDCGSCHISFFGSPGACLEVVTENDCTNPANPTSVQSQITNAGLSLPVVFRKDSFCDVSTQGECSSEGTLIRLYEGALAALCPGGVEASQTFPPVTSCGATTTTMAVTIPTTMATVADCGSCHISMFGSPGMCIEVLSPYECTDATNPTSIQSQINGMGLPLPVTFEKDTFCSTDTTGECSDSGQTARLYNAQFNSFCANGVEPTGTYPPVTMCGPTTTMAITVPTTMATIADCGSCHISMFGSPGMCMEVLSPYECTDETNPLSVQSQVEVLPVALPVTFEKDTFCSTDSIGECLVSGKTARLYNPQFNSFCSPVEPTGTYPPVTMCGPTTTTMAITVPTTLATTLPTTRPTRPTTTTMPGGGTGTDMENMEPEMEPERPITMPTEPDAEPESDNIPDVFRMCGKQHDFLKMQKQQLQLASKICRMRNGGCPLRCKGTLMKLVKGAMMYGSECPVKEFLTYVLKMSGVMHNLLEMGCMDDSCGPDEMKCMSGMCVAKEEWCDGVPDCRDGSDEKFCACTMPTLQCPESIVAAHCGPTSDKPSGGCTDPRCPGKSYEELMELGCTMKPNPDCMMDMPPKETCEEDAEKDKKKW